MTNKEKCDHLVRNHPANKELMELEFGCEVTGKIPMGVEVACLEDGKVAKANLFKRELEVPYEGMKVEILGKPPHLEHYLRVLGEEYDVKLGGKNELILKRHTGGDLLNFNLTTGAPATEEAAEAYIKLVS